MVIANGRLQKSIIQCEEIIYEVEQRDNVRAMMHSKYELPLASHTSILLVFELVCGAEPESASAVTGNRSIDLSGV